ncbi:hypothetical protein AZI87_06405 [Bdellovibrio bacteriovorus]|uniref:Outer membrane lipoprotein-sorting protein n=1 Tax=Bdellovibrio bacteriovorus TaxID=959 RepID=A0A162GSI6_BDEBC|nr:hypothetical protein [Bdellovibrio bacteriovorus]KYG68857.1 hypothetical protein AZI87_06405 [Bdellovibrio bacteriovorus]
MKKFILLLSVVVSAQAWAYIPPTRTILQKTVENAGSGIYAIEQEVQFSNGDDTLSVKETWLIDSDRTMRLTVTGGKDLQNNFRLQFLYNGGQKWSMTGNNRKSEKAPDDFLEKYLNFRNAEIFANTLAHFKIIPTTAYNKKALPRTGAEIKYEPETWVRYSRTGGVVNYALGIPTPVEKEINYPGLWIEQDQFVVRKLRLPSQVEMSADNYNQFAKNLSYPRSRTIRWGNNTVTIRLISASARPQTAVSLFQPSSLDSNLKWDGISGLPAKDVVTEFYTRFR